MTLVNQLKKLANVNLCSSDAVMNSSISSDELMIFCCTVFKIFIGGGMSSDIWPEFSFTAMCGSHPNALLQFPLELEHCKPHKVAHHPTKCDKINNVRPFPSVYHRIYCHKFLTLSNQTAQYKIKCIRMHI